MPNVPPTRFRLAKPIGIAALLALRATLFATETLGQESVLGGFVTDHATGRPLELVNIFVLRDDLLLAGDVSTTDGLYLIPGLEPGGFRVVASYVGYRTFVDSVALSPGERRSLNIELEPVSAELDVAVVESEGDAGAARTTAGLQTIRPADLARIPTLDVAGDLAGYLSSLPGVVSTADRGGQLYIRGGEPSQNLVLVDGIPLLQPFHLVGFYSAFPADVLQRADIYAGGFGSRFGGRISSVLDVSTRNGNLRAVDGAASASPFLVSGRLEGPLVRDRVSLLASGRQSVMKETVGPMLAQDLPFVFGDAFAKLWAVVNERGRASATVLHSYDRSALGLDPDAQSPEAVRYATTAAGLRYLFLPDRYSSILDFHFTYSTLRSETGPIADPIRFSRIAVGSLGLDISVVRPGYVLNLGAELGLKEIETSLGGLYQNVLDETSLAGQWASFVEVDMNLGRGWRLQPGVHLAAYSHRIGPYAEPRIRLVGAVGRQQISAAAGVYHQELLGLSDRRDAARVFTAWTNVPRPTPWMEEDVRMGRLQKATHLIAGYQYRPSLTLDLAVEGFYKSYDNLLIEEWTAFPRFTTALQPATGRSAGFEARAEWSSGSRYLFASYGFSNTRYAAKQAELPLWYGSETLRFRPPHDRRHQLSFVGGINLRSVDLNLRWTFGSGLPFSRPIGFDDFVLISDVTDVTGLPTSRRVIYERPYNSLLPSYHRLDISADRPLRLGFATGTLHLSLINAYNRHNLFYLDTFTQRRVNQFPLLPSIGVDLSW